jgi:hypothetical protein
MLTRGFYLGTEKNMIILNGLTLGFFTPQPEPVEPAVVAKANGGAAEIELSKTKAKEADAKSYGHAQIPFTMAFRPYM